MVFLLSRYYIQPLPPEGVGVGRQGKEWQQSTLKVINFPSTTMHTKYMKSNRGCTKMSTFPKGYTSAYTTINSSILLKQLPFYPEVTELARSQIKVK